MIYLSAEIEKTLMTWKKWFFFFILPKSRRKLWEENGYIVLLFVFLRSMGIVDIRFVVLDSYSLIHLDYIRKRFSEK